MSTKSTKPKPSFRYTPDDLKPRDPVAEEKFVDDFIARNRDAILEDVKASRASIKAGKGKAYTSPQELTADIMRGLRRSPRKT